MSNLANSYPIFEDNQVLTSSQLNELVNYLDEQSRLTRVKLIGMGVACGFVPVFNLQDPDFGNRVTLKITCGTGITSEGYLLKMGDCTVTKYRPYTVPASISYDPFGPPLYTGLNFFEMLTDDAEEDPSNPTSPITQAFFGSGESRKIVMLFLEVFDNDLGSCLSKACDELGKERTFTIRKLAVSKSEIDQYIFPTPQDASEFLFPGKYDLPEVTMPRVLFSPDSDHSKGYIPFSVNYIDTMRKKFSTLFKDALPATYTVFEPILGPLYNSTNPLLNTSVESLLTNFMNGSFTIGPKYLGMQYAYDYMKDLILAYNEFRDTTFDLMSKCCPDMGLFPKHLMLGEAIATGECRPSEYRHHFLEALVTRDQKFLMEKALTLHKRLVLMTQKFDLATINNPNAVVTPPNPLGELLLITPSDDKRIPLSDRAIPYYYRNDESDSVFELGTLEKNWSYDYLRKCLEDKGITPLSYNNQSADQSTPSDEVSTPLYFDIDKYSFLRIEGHLRQNYEAVVDQLEKMKADFDLPFNVVALRLQGPEPDEIRERCNFDDLRTQYLSVREELLCTFKPIFDRFASKSEAGISMHALPVFISEMINDAENSSNFIGSITDFQNAFQSYKKPTTSTLFTEAVPAENFTARSVSVASPLVALTKKITNVRSFLQQALYELCLRLDRLMYTQTGNITLLPFDLAHFDFGVTEPVPGKSFIKTYVEAMQYAINTKVWLNHMLDQLIRTPKIRQTPELYFVLSQYCAEVFAQLDKIISGSLHRKLEMVFYTLEFRMQYLKENDQTLFSNFIRKHPGLEHRGGVEPGGTFIVVYNGNAVGIDPIKRRNIIELKREVAYRSKQVAVAEARPVLTDDESVQLVKDKQFIAAVADLEVAIANPVIPSFRIDIDKEQVIADFALPYLCCSNSECDEVPKPTSLEDLNLPAIAMPAYVEYKLGDYAFTKDLDLGTNLTPNELKIDVLPMLQYENSFAKTSIRLKLIDGATAKHYFDSTTTDHRTGSSRVASTMTTFNATSQLRTSISGARGTAAVKVDNASGEQFIGYTPASGFQGIDSFYYLFEIIDTNGNVIRRSSVGRITINVNSVNKNPLSIINQAEQNNNNSAL